MFEELHHHPPADALALVRGIHPDRVNLILVGAFSAEPGHPGVADEFVVGAGGDVADVLRLQLGQKGPGRPRIVAVEQLSLQFGAPGGIVAGQRVVHDRHLVTATDGLASGRRRYSGINGAGSAVQSVTARTRPATVGYTGGRSKASSAPGTSAGVLTAGPSMRTPSR